MEVYMKTKIALYVLALSASLSAAEFKISYDVSTCRNRRSYQEDRFAHANINDGQFFAVYDGHGGDKVSSFLKDNLHTYFQQCLGDSKKQCFEDAFAKAEDYVLKNYNDGSTAVVAYVDKDNTLHYAWAGDSRAVLECGGKACFFTHDHKPERIDEKARIQKAGGMVYFHGVWRVNGIAVSRSIGDKQEKEYGLDQIIALPEYADIQLTPHNHFMIVASDGLWDEMSNEEAVDMVTKGLQDQQSLKSIAETLQNTAIKKGSRDNITVCVVKFDW
jgi:protein phosphatase 1L